MNHGNTNGRSPHWTKRDHDRLIAFVRRHGPKWALIGEELNRSYSSCQARFQRFGPADLKAKFTHRNAPDLTPEQIEEATRIRRSGLHGKMEIARVAKIMGVRPVQLLRVFMPHEVARKKYTPLFDEPRYQPEKISVPPSVWAERDRAMSRDRLCAAELLGDPPAGRSALDRRIGMAA